jgi:hypothetical protein
MKDEARMRGLKRFARPAKIGMNKAFCLIAPDTRGMQQHLRASNPFKDGSNGLANSLEKFAPGQLGES